MVPRAVVGSVTGAVGVAANGADQPQVVTLRRVALSRLKMLWDRVPKNQPRPAAKCPIHGLWLFVPIESSAHDVGEDVDERKAADRPLLRRGDRVPQPDAAVRHLATGLARAGAPLHEGTSRTGPRKWRRPG